MISYKIIFVFIILLLTSCADYQNKIKIKKDQKEYYSSLGFTLIYNDALYEQKVIKKKMNNDKIQIMHSTLKLNTPVKIINPINLKFIDTKISKKGEFPNIFNSVISKKIAKLLELDRSEPYVEIYEIKKNKTFVAKESNTFEEEKRIADSAPVDDIQMDDLSVAKQIEKKITDTPSNYMLVISDFYYFESAANLKDELVKETNYDKFSIKKINDNKYRLSAGPFKNFISLKSTYISLNNLGFENLTVNKE